MNFLRRRALPAFAIALVVALPALALWDLFATPAPRTAPRRRTFALAVPVAVYAAWAVVVRLRLGSWPSGKSDGRLAYFGTGLFRGLVDHPSVGLVLGVAAAAGLCILAVIYARHDALTWIALAFAAFASTFGTEVWLHAGFVRTLLPLYVFSAVALAGAFTARAHDEPVVGEPLPATEAQPGSVVHAGA